MSGSSLQRQRLNFSYAVTEHFDFVRDYGFALFESTPTIVRYRKGDLQINIFHGRKSYEIGMEISRGGETYSIGALMRLMDPARADQYRYYAATTPAGVMAGVQQLAALVSQYGQKALQGDLSTFVALVEQRGEMAKNLELDSIAAQVRPRAEVAFRDGKYREAAELYKRILPRLSAAELKKLEFARKKSGVQ